MRVKRLLKAGVISALACMVKADSAILTDQTKELLARCNQDGLGRRGAWVEANLGDGEHGEETGQGRSPQLKTCIRRSLLVTFSSEMKDNLEGRQADYSTV